MSNDINLISSKTFQLEKQIKTLKLIRIIAVFSLAAVALVAVLLFVITLILPISSVKKDQSETLSSISLLGKKQIKYLLINDRIVNIAQIVKERKNYSVTADAILTKLSADLIAESMTINEGELILVVSSSSLLSIDDFLKSVVVIGDKENIIKNLSIQSLVINAINGKYTLTIQADIL